MNVEFTFVEVVCTNDKEPLLIRNGNRDLDVGINYVTSIIKI